MTDLRYTREDAAVPALRPPDRAYLVHDAAGRFRGIVAGSGRLWAAGRPGPLRSRPWVAVVQAESRDAAARRLVDGRP
jgi:hypothetical protein